MLILLQSSQVPVWLYIVSLAITASGSWLIGWLNRKRRSSIKAEDGKLVAEAHRLEIQNIADLLQELRDTRAEVNSLAREGRARAEENRKQQDFLRGQVKWHEELSIVARTAAHSALDEIQRCVWAIQLRDDAIKEAKAALQCAEDMLTENKIKFTKAKLEDVPPFERKEYKAILDYQALPLPPS